MNTGFAIALALAAFIAGAFLTTAVAHGGMGSGMGAMMSEQMMAQCEQMMQAHASNS